jgi:hypothetical protein
MRNGICDMRHDNGGDAGYDATPVIETHYLPDDGRPPAAREYNVVTWRNRVRP